MKNPELVFDLNNVTVKTHKRTILDIPTLKVPPGTMLGIVGTNGAGKTTLLNVLCGLRRYRGNTSFSSQNWKKAGFFKRAAMRRTIGYVGQSAIYNSELPFTLLEVVLMARAGVRGLFKPLKSEDKKIARLWLDKLGLAHLENQKFGTLSGGEQQKALIARAMAQNPRVLLLDEPCSNLDFRWKYEISNIIENIYKQNDLSVIMVSHDISLLPACCQRIVLMSDGKIVMDGTCSDVLNSQNLSRAYGCPIKVDHIGNRTYAAFGGEK